MNPAILNYLQSQQSQQNSQGSAVSQPQTPYNPFDAGISKAIASARQSLAMTRQQEEQALRSSMLAFADNMRAQPKQRGFWNNVGSVGGALSPAISAYDRESSNALRENNQIANQILAYDANEKAVQAQEEERLWRRQQQEAMLNEQKRSHDLMYNLQSRKTQNVEPISIAGVELLPITDRKDYIAYNKDKKALGTTLHELDNIEKNYQKFRANTKDNLTDPMGPFAKVANPTKDLFGKFFDNKELRKETAHRKTLNSQLNKFVISSERALRGGGVLGPTLINLFKQAEIYPDLEKDTPEIFESKMKMLKEELSNSYKASDLSLKYKSHINPSDIANFENANNQNTLEGSESEQENIPANQEWILMTDPETGEQQSVYFEDISKALQNGLIKNE